MKTDNFYQVITEYKGVDSYGFKVDKHLKSPKYGTLEQAKEWLNRHKYYDVIHGFGVSDSVKMSSFEVKKIKITIEEESVPLLCKFKENDFCTMVNCSCSSNIIDCKIAKTF